MSLVKGKNVILSFYDLGLWQPLACARSCDLITNSETGETSTLESGVWRTYKAIKMNWSISFDGLVSLDMNMAVRRLRDIQFALKSILISFDATDDNGLTENYTGYIIVTSVSTPASYNGMYEYSGEGLGNGSLNITELPVDPNVNCDCISYWYYYDAVGGEFSIGPIPELVANIIDGRILRDGVEYRPSGVLHDGSASPVGREFSFDAVTGTIAFDSTTLPPLEPGEIVDIPYIVCPTEPPPACTPVTIQFMPLANAVLSVFYYENLHLNGTGPFMIEPGAVKPSWMTIIVIGDTVQLSGTPDAAGTNQEVSFTISNCEGGNTDSYFDTMNVIAPGTVRFGNSVFIASDNTSEDREVDLIGGDPGSTVTITCNVDFNDNGGGFLFNGIIMSDGSSIDITLGIDGTYPGIPVHLDGAPTADTSMSATFTIFSTTSGTIGSPNSYNINKNF